MCSVPFSNLQDDTFADSDRCGEINSVYYIFNLRKLLILEDAKPDQMGLVSEMYKNHRIIEWLGLERTLKPTQL